MTRSIILQKTDNHTRNLLISLSLTFILLNALGFPGSYTRVFGDSFGVLIEYASFLLQIMLMLFSSGKTAMDIKIINTNPKYRSLYLMFFIISVCSMIAAYDKGEEIVSCIRITVTALFAIWLCENLTVEELLERLYHAQILFVLASVAFPVLFPGYDTRGASYQTMFVGISSVKNVVAAELAFGLVMCVVLLRIRLANKGRFPKILILFILFQLILLHRTEGTGALIMAIAISAYVLVIDKITGKRFHWGIIYVVGSILFLIAALTIMPVFEPFLTALGKDATLTGRIPLWRQLIAVMKEHKTMLGFGYGLFWRDPNALALMHAGFERNSWAANMSSGAHNNLLELWANTGLIGVSAFFGAILVSLRNITDRRKVSPERYIFCTGYILYYLIRGWTEKAVTTYEYDLLFLCITMAMGCVGAERGEPECEKHRVRQTELSTSMSCAYLRRSR